MTHRPELFLLRHGETEWNVEGRLQGRLDSPLTARGRDQAQAQGAILDRHCPKGVRILSSPAPRALTTARIATAALHGEIETDDRLLEIDIGGWTGRSIREIAAANPHVAQDEDPFMWKFTAPGGESLEHMTARCRDLLDALDEPAVLVTHGVTSRVLRCLALGMAPTALSELPGGQGVVHHLSAGRAQLLTG